MSYQNLLFSLILMLFVSALSAQTLDYDYWDGQAYFKFNNDSELVIEDMDQLKNQNDLKDIRDILMKHGLTKIERPFINLRTPIFDRTYEIRFSNIENIQELINDLESLSDIEYAERVPIMRKSFTPNDPDLGTQWSLDKINAAQAWDLHQGGDAIIAIVDDAVNTDHEDLAPNKYINLGEIAGNSIDDDNNGYIDDVSGWDAADNDANPNSSNAGLSHGTHVAGIASAATNNNTGMASIGFNCKIMGVKSNFDTSSGASLNNPWGGFSYAISAGAHVINCSWGGSGASSTNQNVVNQAHALGITVVAAAGNDNNDLAHYPSNYEHVISVASTAESDIKSGFSNFGESVDISAPGTAIYSTLPNNNYGNQQGTSMASPMVAGLCGLIKSFNPLMSPGQIEACLKSTAANIDGINSSHAGLLGAGRIDAFEALQCASPNSAPIILVSSNAETICPGESVQFEDISFYTPSVWSWTFEGGNPSTSNIRNPEVYYSTPGTYNVTLSAGNDIGTTSETLTGYIIVDDGLSSLIMFDDFEDGDFNGWTTENIGGGPEWEIIELDDEYGITGDYAMKIANFSGNTTGAVDGLVSRSFNLYGHTSATLEFDYAYRMNIESESDVLGVSVSTDGGNTFTEIFSETEDGSYNMATYVLLNGEFTPQANIDWCGQGVLGASCISIDLSNQLSSDVVFKIKNTSRGGNNLYVDNIRLTASCPTANIDPLADWSASKRTACGSTLTTKFFDESKGVPTSWSWSFPGGSPATSTERNPEVTYGSTGSYEVSLTVTNAAGSSTTTETNYIVVATQEPTADFDVVTSWSTASFNNMSQDGVEYHWDFGDGTTSTAANPFHNYWNIGESYTVTLTVTNGCGTDVYTQNIQTTSIENPFGENTSFNIYPNPNSGQFTIEVKGKDSGMANISVYDVLGRTVHQSTYSLNSQDWKQQIDVQGQATGTYIVEMEIDGLSTYEKIVIR